MLGLGLGFIIFLPNIGQSTAHLSWISVMLQVADE